MDYPMSRRTIGLVVTLLLLAGCSRQVVGPASRPGGHRVLSMSPGLTSIVFGMGLGDEVVGVTRYCILPPGVDLPRLGDRQNLTGEALLQLNPDMIFVQQDPRQFEELRKFKPDLRIEHFTLERIVDVPQAMNRIGALTGHVHVGEQAAEAFRAKLKAVDQRVKGLPERRVLFVMGTDRPVVAGPETFLSDMIQIAGGTDVGASIEGYTRWREASVEGILKAAPDVIICQVDPGQEAAAKEFWMSLKDLPAVKQNSVFVVSERLWTIPGPHLADLTAALAEMIHPPSPASTSPAPSDSAMPSASQP